MNNLQAVTQLLKFEEFLEQYPENGGRYELFNGKIREMRPIGSHEKVAALIARKIDTEIERLALPYFIPRTCLVKPVDTEGHGYLPDIIVLDEEAVSSDPYWKTKSSISLGASAKLVIEVVSTNWQDDYLTKLAEYEKLGIFEYWIVDYRALGGIRYIGSPKIPTVWIYNLSESEYTQVNRFQQGNEQLKSQVFPELVLTVEQILLAGK